MSDAADFDNSAMTIAILAGATLIVTVLVLIAVLHMNRTINTSMPGQSASEMCKHGNYDQRTGTCRPHHAASNFLTYGGDLNQHVESHGKHHTRTRSNIAAKAQSCPGGMWSDSQEQCIGRSFGGPASDLVQTTAMEPRDPVEDMFRKHTHLD